MEMALNMGAFEALDQQEMLATEGGLGPWGWMAAGFAVDGVVEAATGRSCGGWISYGINWRPNASQQASYTKAANSKIGLR